MRTRLLSHQLWQLVGTIAAAIVCGALWGVYFLIGDLLPRGVLLPIIALLVVPAVSVRLVKEYRRQGNRVRFLLEAVENGDTSVHFSSTQATDEDERLVNEALNRLAALLHSVKNETARREKYYEFILESIQTALVVLTDTGAVHQKNSEALRLLGLNVFTHVRQLEAVDGRLARLLEECRAGDKFQTTLCNERGTMHLFVRVSEMTVHSEHLRVLVLTDINNELDEKEIDSWIRLIRVLTHEIMNAVTPMTSISDSLLAMPHSDENLISALQTISSTGKSLLAFVDSYRKFTRIPAPVPRLFYVREFVQRMVEVARHQYADARIEYTVSIEPDDLILYADEHLIAQVVTNILKNAVQAIASAAEPTEGCIRIHACCNEAEEVLIEISNNGPPIPPDVADHIFIPFFTTKEGGSGIGLSVSRQIMRMSGGSLSLIANKQTAFLLTFH